MYRIFASLLLIGCNSSGVLQAPIEVLPGSGDFGPTPMIYGGSAPAAPEHDAVVALHQLTSGGASVYVQPFCTGTLVTDEVVVTAAHCLDTSRGGRNFKEMSPSDLAIYVGDDPSLDITDHLYSVSDLEIHVSYSRSSLLNDIAILRLSSAITESVTPVPYLPSSAGFSASDAGMDINFAGFGEAEDGTSGVKLQVDGILDGLGCSLSGCPAGSDTATQVSYAQGNGGPCFGDSGGPLFIDRGGTTYLAGVTSYGDAYCTVYGVSTRVDAYQGWIDSYTGTDDTGTDDTGTDDTGTDDTGTDDTGTCGDGVCDADESCDGRDNTSACADDCPGKTNGRPSERYCYVGDTCEGDGCP